MDSFAFAIVILAAALHAGWNALVKVEGDRLVAAAALCVFAAIAAAVALPFFPPPHPDSWPFIAVSATLHTGYMMFLIKAYQHGDLSHVYPLARGSAPLMVALFSVFVLGDPLPPTALFGVVLIGVGIMSLVLATGVEWLANRRAIFYALGTGVFIAVYTVWDAIGAGKAGGAHGYVLCIFILVGLLHAAIVFARRGPAAFDLTRAKWQIGAIGGACSLGAYWLVVHALTLAPMPLVAALRETSIVIAVLIGVFVLRERLNIVRVLSTAATLLGVALAKIGSR